MKRTAPLFLLLIILFLYFWQPAATPSRLLAQIKGDGCVYDWKCGSHWTWWQKLTINHPQVSCVAIAATCLATFGEEAKPLLPELKSVRQNIPEYFNTGDGPKSWGNCIDLAIYKIETGTEKPVIGSFTCSRY